MCLLFFLFSPFFWLLLLQSIQSLSLWRKYWKYSWMLSIIQVQPPFQQILHKFSVVLHYLTALFPPKNMRMDSSKLSSRDEWWPYSWKLSLNLFSKLMKNVWHKNQVALLIFAQIPFVFLKKFAKQSRVYSVTAAVHHLNNKSWRPGGCDL